RVPGPVGPCDVEAVGQGPVKVGIEEAELPAGRVRHRDLVIDVAVGEVRRERLHPGVPHVERLCQEREGVPRRVRYRVDLLGSEAHHHEEGVSPHRVDGTRGRTAPSSRPAGELRRLWRNDEIPRGGGGGGGGETSTWGGVGGGGGGPKGGAPRSVDQLVLVAGEAESM